MDRGVLFAFLPSTYTPLGYSLAKKARIRLALIRKLYSRRAGLAAAASKIGRDVGFSAYLCYNGVNEKPLSRREPMEPLVHH